VRKDMPKEKYFFLGFAPLGYMDLLFAGPWYAGAYAPAYQTVSYTE
jgi:hypothetical protein